MHTTETTIDVAGAAWPWRITIVLSCDVLTQSGCIVERKSLAAFAEECRLLLYRPVELLGPSNVTPERLSLLLYLTAREKLAHELARGTSIDSVGVEKLDSHTFIRREWCTRSRFTPTEQTPVVRGAFASLLRSFGLTT